MSRQTRRQTSLGGGKKRCHERHFRLYKLFSYLFTAEPADQPHTNLVEHALGIPQSGMLVAS